MSELVPLYSPTDLHPAFQLRYGWSAWPSSGSFPALPACAMWEELQSQWESDGLRVLESHCSGELVQVTFSARPDVSPLHLAARAKGRLDHAWRARAGSPVRFSRKVAVRSIGETTREAVEQYIAGQVSKEQFTDARFERLMRQFTVENPSADLSRPTETNSGRYWYNLHVVLVVVERFRIVDEQRLATIRDGCFGIATNKGFRISQLSVMPDHVHLALRGDIALSPAQIVLALLNNLAFALGQQRWWSGNCYLGTFSEYNMNAVRKLRN